LVGLPEILNILHAGHLQENELTIFYSFLRVSEGSFLSTLQNYKLEGQKTTIIV